MQTALLLLLLSPAPDPNFTAHLDVRPEAALDSEAVALDDFKDRMKAAGDDVEALWALYEWTQEDKKNNKYAKRVLNKILKVDPDHEPTRAALGHVFFDDQWFDSERKLESYKKKNAERLGLVKYKDEWVAAADLPYIRKGLKKDEIGRWYDPMVKQRLEEGWVQQDLVWVAPDEKENIDKGLWKCGKKWLSLEEANEFHAYLGDPWIIPSKRTTVWSYADRETALKAIDIAEKAYFDASKATGFGPEQPIPFLVAKDQEQFLRFCDGDGEVDHPQVEPRALSSQIKFAFADLWFDFEEERYLGMGATYWDPGEENADVFAIHFVRFAYGLSFMDFIDPVPELVDEVLADEEVNESFFFDRQDMRKLPEWLHWGVASYVGRWFVDTSVGQGGNARWAAEWSAANITNKGGLDDIGTILDFEIGAGNEDTAKLINEAGLLVAFCVDGKDTEATKLFNDVFETLRKGADPENNVDDLRSHLMDSEDGIRAFAKL